MLFGACDDVEQSTHDAYFSTLVEDTTLRVSQKGSTEVLLPFEPARCYRITGKVANGPVVATIVDDGGAPVRTATSAGGHFEMGKEFGFCTRVVKGPYFLRLRTNAEQTTVVFRVEQSQR